MRLPIAVEKIIARLENAGFEAYAVGGCVRDSLLGRLPDDWDITTSALPAEVKQLFRRTIDTGIQHGTVTVLMSGADTILRGERGYEVTTYRVDGAYLDGRHPSTVAFTPSLHEDLARRDFTINAMAYNPRAGLVDDFGGLRDLSARQIRAVGIAEQRFTEDALRMLRALRFSAQLSFEIEEETKLAVRTLAPNLRKVSKERIQAELSKLLLSEHPEHYRRIFETGLAPYITPHFPELLRRTRCGRAAAPESPGAAAAEPSYPAMPDSVPRKKYLRYGMLLRNVPELAGQILRELKLDNETIRMGRSIAALHGREIPETAYQCRRLLSEYGSELLSDWLRMEEALLSEEDSASPAYCGAGPETAGGGGTVPRTVPGPAPWDSVRPGGTDRERLQKIRQAEKQIEEILSRGDCLSIAGLAVNGRDLMEQGIESGPKLGEMLHMLLDYVLEEPERNHRETLLRRLFLTLL